MGAAASGWGEWGTHGAGAAGLLRFPSPPLEAPGGLAGEGGCGGAQRRRGESGERACPRGGGAGAAGGDEPDWGGGTRARSPGEPPGCVCRAEGIGVRILTEPRKAVPGAAATSRTRSSAVRARRAVLGGNVLFLRSSLSLASLRCPLAGKTSPGCKGALDAVLGGWHLKVPFRMPGGASWNVYSNSTLMWPASSS